MKQMITQVLKGVSAAAALSVTLLLSACVEPGAPEGPFTPADASRFLHQSTFGATQADIDRLISLGYEGWMNEQFDMPASDTYLDYVNRGGPPDCERCPAVGQAANQEAFWYQVVEGKDQVRQRVAFALSELFVISAATNNVLRDQDLAVATFHTMLAQNALGNFRDLLEKVALHPAMGVYLSHLQNEKEDPATGRLPDENFAREVMQLFTIGKWMLNADGTRQLDSNGQPIPAYTQADIMGMAKVFTGWSWGGSDTSDQRWFGYNIGAEDTRQWHLPMQPYANRHSSAEKAIVNGVVIPAGTSATESVRIALDTLYNHPNTAPFIVTHLIKRLVTSNPSPQYVSRVVNVFNSNANQERGNLRSVVRAILFDPEARSLDTAKTATWGKLREPVLRVSNYLRAFNARNSIHTYDISPLQQGTYDVGQTPWMAPSVFNFFTPDHAPAGAIAEAGLVAPEFQIFDEASSVGYINYLQRGVDSGFGTAATPIKPDYSKELPLASDPTALTARLDMLLNGGQTSEGTRADIITAVQSIPVGSNDWQMMRIRAAITLLMASPDYLVQK